MFAIAITLLVLEVRVPEGAGDNLAHELANQWPSYLAYVVSFLVIGIIWMNHHAVVDHLRQTDRPLMALNLFLLLGVGLIPWPTRLVAEKTLRRQKVATTLPRQRTVARGPWRLDV